jgi:RHS repeat-associated protein
MFSYLDNLSDRRLERITNTQGATPISEFSYSYDVAAERITRWSQKSGTQAPVIYALGHDAANQLKSAGGSQNGNVAKTFAYTYDPVGNRLTEQLNGATRQFSSNALNELTTVDHKPEVPKTYQWDAANRLVAVGASNRLTRFDYDGFGRRVGTHEVVDSTEVSNKRYIWCGSEICEERNVASAVVKRFFRQGMEVETGATAGKYFYTRDHLGSVREVIDNAGSVRARFDYDPYGSQSRMAGDLEVDFGFAGYWYDAGTALCLTPFRAYDSELGHWLSREPFANAENLLGPNLYTYVFNDPIKLRDRLGLQAVTAAQAAAQATEVCATVHAETAEHFIGEGAGAVVECTYCAMAPEGLLTCAMCGIHVLIPSGEPPPPGPPDNCEPWGFEELAPPCQPEPICPEPPSPPAPPPLCIDGHD